MTCYVDPLRDWGWRLGPSCHLIADTLDELHTMAEAIGLRRAWFQNSRSVPHYDLVASRRARAVAAGAVELDRLAFVTKCREIRSLCRCGCSRPATWRVWYTDPNRFELCCDSSKRYQASAAADLDLEFHAEQLVSA